MVKVVVLSANGERRTLNTSAFTATTATGAAIAKALRKTKPAAVVMTYPEKHMTVWGWAEGKAGTENSHELPPDAAGLDAPVLYGDIIIVSSLGDYTEDQYAAFYEEASGGFNAAESDSEEEAEIEAEAEDIEEED